MIGNLKPTLCLTWENVILLDTPDHTGRDRVWELLTISEIGLWELPTTRGSRARRTRLACGK